jgi:hypothetical protein
LERSLPPRTLTQQTVASDAPIHTVTREKQINDRNIEDSSLRVSGGLDAKQARLRWGATPVSCFIEAEQARGACQGGLPGVAATCASRCG